MTEVKAFVCEPLKDGVKLADRIKEVKPKTCLLIFWHGVGDLVMFLEPVRQLQFLYPEIDFTIGLPGGLTHEEILTEDDPYVLLTGDEVNVTTEDLPFDLVAKITFPMNEGQLQYTKGEWCCLHELGIEPVWGHAPLKSYETRLVAVHFQITCLPDSCNPDRETAERIWNDILGAGWIPLESHFLHTFANPVNAMFPFIDATVRRCKARVSSLAGLIENAGAFVGVVSGPFHVALASLPPERVFLLEKDFKRECFTKADIAHADLRNYQGEVKTFLEGLE